ncbi:MAG: rod shape-determining protein RodA, partial [Chitinophagales bacterium]
MSSRKSSILAKLDWLTVFLYLSISLVGLAFIYSTTYAPNNPAFFNFDTSYGRQFMWMGISLVIAAIILIIDSKFYTSFAYIIYGFVMLLLVSVLIFGVKINGSTSWFAFGPIRFQPAELAKFATCLGLAKYFTEVNVTMKNNSDKLKAAGLVLLPVALVLLQGDVGSALVFFSLIFVLHREGLSSWFLTIGFSLIFFSLMALLYKPFILVSIYAAGLSVFVYFNQKKKFPYLKALLVLVGLVLLGGLYTIYINPLLVEKFIYPFLPLAAIMTIILSVGAFLFYKRKSWVPFFLLGFFTVVMYTFSIDYIFNNLFKQHHRDRINIILGKVEDHSGIGYNLFQSKIAIGSGGWIGKGYLEGTQTMFNFVPEQSTDFIFTSIAEELGFMGSFLIISLFMALLLRIVAIAERQRSRLARVYGYGVVSILFFHFAINIAMTVGL